MRRALLALALLGGCRTANPDVRAVAVPAGAPRANAPARSARDARIDELETSLAAAGTRDPAVAGELAELHALEAIEGPPARRDAHWVAAATFAHAAAASATDDERLALLEALADARLGFRVDAARRLGELVELDDAHRTLELLERVGLEKKLWTGILAAAHERARATDELEAYRFAVLALEGGERFGSALPAPDAERLTDWILTGAKVEFVCPESHTTFVPGLTRSPISGIPHLDYVAVERRKR